MWAFYFPWLTLYLFGVINFTVDQYVTWVWTGVIVDLILAYPMAKVLYHWYLPKLRGKLGIEYKNEAFV